jgi:type IV pilus assembly protein PilA
MQHRNSRLRGFTLVELLIVVAIIVILLAVAVPNFVAARQNATETIVIREVQTIHQAQTQYFSQFGKYADTLVELGPAVSGNDGPAGSNLIPASIASGEKDGYLFEMTHTNTGFALNARPRVFGTNGRRNFYMDQSGIVHQNWGQEPASVNSAELK